MSKFYTLNIFTFYGIIQLNVKYFIHINPCKFINQLCIHSIQNKFYMPTIINRHIIYFSSSKTLPRYTFYNPSWFSQAPRASPNYSSVIINPLLPPPRRTTHSHSNNEAEASYLTPSIHCLLLLTGPSCLTLWINQRNMRRYRSR